MFVSARVCVVECIQKIVSGAVLSQASVRTEPRQSPKTHAIANFAIKPHRTAAKLARRKSKFTL